MQSERLAAANAAAAKVSQTEPFTPTPEEQRQIDEDARRSADVMFYDLPRPSQVNARVHQGLARELIEKHYQKPTQERAVIYAVTNVADLTRRLNGGPDFVDSPFEIGTKFRVLYGGNPRCIVPIDNLNLWPEVSERIERYRHSAKPHCDAKVTKRCLDVLPRLQVIHYKIGQFLCIHAACDRCVDYLMNGFPAAHIARVEKLLALVEKPQPPPDLKLV
jgi:hypothetical protein